MDTNLSLLPESEKHFEELNKKRADSLERLVTGKTPKEFVYDKPGRGGGTQDFVPGWWFIQEMNNIFGHLWSQEVVDYKIDEKLGQIVAKVRITVSLPSKKVVEKYPDGRIIETTYEGLKVVKEQFGGSDIKKMKATGAVTDLADDCKAAATDGMKKCMTLLGLAREIYGPREVIDEFAGMTTEEIKLRPIIKRTGWDVEKAKAWYEEVSGKKVEKSYDVDVTMTLQKLPKSEKK